MLRRRGSLLTHPRMMSHIARTHMRTSFCSISEPKETFDSFNRPTITYEPIKQLTAIPCYKEVLTVNTEETRQDDQTVVTGWFSVMLSRYCPTITEAMQATINAVDYNIRSVYHDDTRTFTMLEVEIVNTQQIEQ